MSPSLDNIVLTYGKELDLTGAVEGPHRVELLVEDTSGNVAVHRMEIEVKP